MEAKMLETAILLFVCFVFSFGFLLDDKTTPSISQQNSGLSDEHYQAVLVLINAEREERLKLEKRVSYLEKELQVAEKAVTDVYHQNQENNHTINDLKIKVNSLISENTLLKRDNSDMKTEIANLKSNDTNIQNELLVVNQDITNIRRLNNVQGLQAIVDVYNVTQRLDKELNHTTTVTRQLNESIIDLLNTFDEFGYDQNATTDKLDSEHHNMSDRVILTACVLGTKTYGTFYDEERKIVFPYVQTKTGISDEVVTNFSRTGVFTVEKTGIYMISAFITTDTTSGYVFFEVVKNRSVIGYGYMNVKSGTQTSTVIRTVHLNANDNIFVRNSIGLAVIGGESSCMSLIQLTF